MKKPAAEASPAITPPATGLGYLSSALSQPETAAEAALRPLSFSDFTGQAKTVERLQVMVGAAKRRGEALNHILLSGPPGLGKTTLAFILGHEMGRNVRVTSGPVVEKAGDLAGLLLHDSVDSVDACALFIIFAEDFFSRLCLLCLKYWSIHLEASSLS
jgi:Holliday junction DNA helicase RuvB